MATSEELGPRKNVGYPHEVHKMLMGDPPLPVHHFVQHEGDVGVGSSETKEGNPKKGTDEVSVSRRVVF